MENKEDISLNSCVRNTENDRLETIGNRNEDNLEFDDHIKQSDIPHPKGKTENLVASIKTYGQALGTHLEPNGLGIDDPKCNDKINKKNDKKTPSLHLQGSNRNLNQNGKEGANGNSSSNKAQLKFNYVDRPMDEITNSSGCLIRMEPDLRKEIGCCDHKLIFHVYSISNNTIKYLFKCKEFSPIGITNCCSMNTKEFLMKVKHISTTGEHFSNFDKTFVQLYKPYQCVGNAKIEVKLIESKTNIGFLRQLPKYCEKGYEIFNKKNEKVYKIPNPHSCTGFCEECSCFNEEQISLPIIGLETGEILGEVTKIQEKSGNIGGFKINFPKDATPEDKCSILMCVIVIYNQYFGGFILQPSTPFQRCTAPRLSSRQSSGRFGMMFGKQYNNTQLDIVWP